MHKDVMSNGLPILIEGGWHSIQAGKADCNSRQPQGLGRIGSKRSKFKTAFKGNVGIRLKRLGYHQF